MSIRTDETAPARRSAKLCLRSASALMLAILINAGAADFVYAAGSGMPWEEPLTKIVDSITGPVARSAGVIAIVVSGMMLAFGEAGGLMRRAIALVFGLAIAFAASSFFLSFLGFAGGTSL